MSQTEFDQFVERTCSVSVTDSQTPLVDLGVDSLQTVALLLTIEEKYGIQVDPQVLACRTSSADLWDHIQQRRANSPAATEA